MRGKAEPFCATAQCWMLLAVQVAPLGREAHTALHSPRCCCALWDMWPHRNLCPREQHTPWGSAHTTRDCTSESMEVPLQNVLDKTVGHRQHALPEQDSFAEHHHCSTSHQPHRLGLGEHLDGRHVRKITFPVQVRSKCIFTQSITPRLMKLTFEGESSTCTQSQLSSAVSGGRQAPSLQLDPMMLHSHCTC